MTVIRWSLLALLTGSLACGGTDVSGATDHANGDGDGDGDSGDGDSGDGDSGDGDSGDGDSGDGDSGDGDGNPGDGDSGDGDSCQEFSVFAKPTTPDMLIVLDRSGSMADNGRWDASSEAVISLTEELNEAIHFGLMLFPKGAAIQQPDPNACDQACADDFLSQECQDCLFGSLPDPGDLNACVPGEVAVEVAANTAGDIANAVNNSGPGGGTPTGGSLQEAAKHIGSSMGGPDQVAVPKYVLLVTDGQPTCPNADGHDQSSGATANQLAADRQLTIDSIDALKSAGVSTFVIGYNVTQFANDMNTFAQHGGTDHYRAVENQNDLVTEFREIAGAIVSCTFVLETAPSDPKKVEVKVDGKQVYVDDEAGEGFTLDGKIITLQEKACSGIQDGEKHQVDVKVTCEEIIPPIK